MRALGSIAPTGSTQPFALAPRSGERVRVRGPRPRCRYGAVPLTRRPDGRRLSPPSGARRRADLIRRHALSWGSLRDRGEGPPRGEAAPPLRGFLGGLLGWRARRW